MSNELLQRPIEQKSSAFSFQPVFRLRACLSCLPFSRKSVSKSIWAAKSRELWRREYDQIWSMDYILPWLWVQLCAISWIIIIAPETVKTTEQVSRLITDNVIANTMGQRNVQMYKEMHVYMGQPSLLLLWSTCDSRANLYYAKALSPLLREEWVTLKGNLFLNKNPLWILLPIPVLNYWKPLFSQRNTALYAINEYCIIGMPHLPEVKIYR